MSTWQPDWFATPGAVAPRRSAAWRGVEAQHVVSTLRLVDDPAEQDLLEQLLEDSNPALPKAARSLHYLLATPFRYAPPHPSRFRPAHAKGQWYGAESLMAACAEVAYWRHRFVQDSAGLRDQTLLTEHSFFQGVLQGTAIDLSWPRERARIRAEIERQSWGGGSRPRVDRRFLQLLAGGRIGVLRFVVTPFGRAGRIAPRGHGRLEVAENPLEAVA